MKKKEAAGSTPAAPFMDKHNGKGTYFFQQIKEVMRELPAVCPRSGEVSLFNLIKKGGEK